MSHELHSQGIIKHANVSSLLLSNAVLLHHALIKQKPYYALLSLGIFGKGNKYINSYHNVWLLLHGFIRIYSATNYDKFPLDLIYRIHLIFFNFNLSASSWKYIETVGIENFKYPQRIYDDWRHYLNMAHSIQPAIYCLNEYLSKSVRKKKQYLIDKGILMHKTTVIASTLQYNMKNLNNSFKKNKLNNLLNTRPDKNEMIDSGFLILTDDKTDDLKENKYDEQEMMIKEANIINLGIEDAEKYSFLENENIKLKKRLKELEIFRMNKAKSMLIEKYNIDFEQMLKERDDEIYKLKMKNTELKMINTELIQINMENEKIVNDEMEQNVKNKCIIKKMDEKIYKLQMENNGLTQTNIRKQNFINNTLSLLTKLEQNVKNKGIVIQKQDKEIYKLRMEKEKALNDLKYKLYKVKNEENIMKKKDVEIDELKTRVEEQKKIIDAFKTKMADIDEAKKKQHGDTEQLRKDKRMNVKKKENDKNNGKENDLKEWMIKNSIYDKNLYSILISNNINSSKQISRLNQNDFDSIIRKFRIAQFAKIKDNKLRDKIDKLLLKFEKSWKKSKNKKVTKK